MITGTWEQTPRGVSYTREHVEYQEFPEEFFSGADAVVYFGDTFIDDITSLQFSLTERVQPIYGYASYTWDTVARGARVMNGSFRIAFREAGYLFKILERLGEIGTRMGPALGKMLAGEEVPEWHADAMQTIEDILSGNAATRPVNFIMIRPPEYDIPPQDAAIIPARLLGDKLFTAVHWDNDRRLVLLGGREFKPYSVEGGRAQLLLRSVCESLGYEVYWSTDDQSIAILRNGKTIALVTKNEYRTIKLPGDRSTMWSRDLGQRLGLPVEWNSARETAVIGGKEFKPQRVVDGKAYVFIREVAEAHGFFVFWYEKTREIIITPAGGGVITPDNYKTVPGQDRAVMPARIFAVIIGASDFKVADDGVYYFGQRFERVDGVYSEPGVYVREVLENLGYAVHWIQDSGLIIYTPADSVIQPSKAGKELEGFQKSIADYEAEIWADPMTPERGEQRHFRPYFYGSEKEAPLLEHGFDIYIVYGPLPYHVKKRLEVLPDYISYNPTVKAIRNVQLMSCAQILDPTGRPVEEEYAFIARDMD